jgi:hypothetical protein
MSEEQGKPKRWYRKQLIIVALLVLLVVFVIVVLTYLLRGEVPYVPYDKAYIVTKDKIQDAVAYYRDANDESLPILSFAYTNAECLNCHVLNISALITANGGLLQNYPDGLNLSDSGNDNCGGNASLGCSTEGSYIWIVDANGNVFSYCAGAGCTTNNSGYQDVWP